MKKVMLQVEPGIPLVLSLPLIGKDFVLTLKDLMLTWIALLTEKSSGYIYIYITQSKKTLFKDVYVCMCVHFATWSLMSCLTTALYYC